MRFKSSFVAGASPLTRPVCYQGCPDVASPDELKDENPLGIWRMVDGQMTREVTMPSFSGRGAEK